MEATLNSTRRDLLHGWKEVAAYLGRSPRAVQRYERELGLPIHRVRTSHGQGCTPSRTSSIDGGVR